MLALRKGSENKGQSKENEDYKTWSPNKVTYFCETNFVLLSFALMNMQQIT